MSTGRLSYVVLLLILPLSLLPRPALAAARTCNVISYGADPSGRHDSVLQIRSAFADCARTAGNTVYLPAGTYLLDRNDGQATDFIERGTNAPNIRGAGRDLVTVIERVGTAAYPRAVPKRVFEWRKTDGTIMDGLTVDTQTWNAGDGLVDYGDRTIIRHSRFLGAHNRDVFGVRVIGVCNADPRSPVYGVHHDSNVIDDLILDARGTGGNADLDVSCQHNVTISNVVDTGWGVALYIDDGVTLTNYHFTPGATQSGPHGWYATSTQHALIDGFVSSGGGGIIASAAGTTSDRITVRNERMTAPDFSFVVRDASNVVVETSQLQKVRLAPYRMLYGLTISGSSYGPVIYGAAPGASISRLAVAPSTR